MSHDFKPGDRVIVRYGWYSGWISFYEATIKTATEKTCTMEQRVALRNRHNLSEVALWSESRFAALKILEAAMEAEDERHSRESRELRELADDTFQAATP